MSDYGECYGCGAELAGDEPDYPHCAACIAARDAHPAWQAIQRVERGETAVTPQPCDWGHMIVRTSDGWLVEVFPDGIAYRDFDYVERLSAPDGTVYAWPEPDCVYTPETLPAYVCMTWRPQHDARWCMRTGLASLLFDALTPRRA